MKYIWAVEVTEPPTDKRQWARPNRYFVIAPDLETATFLTKKHHPGVTLIKILRDRNVDDVLIFEADEITST